MEFIIGGIVGFLIGQNLTVRNWFDRVYDNLKDKIREQLDITKK